MTLALNYERDLFVASDKTTIDRGFYNRRTKAIFDAVVDLDTRVSSFGAAESTLVALGLDRLNETLGPLLVTLQGAADLGFLVCKSAGIARSLTLGGAIGWVITTGADIFTPTPYLLAQDDTDSTNWGILSVDPGGWTQSAATLATHVAYASKTQSSLQWTISANSALLPAMQSLLTQANTANTNAQAALTTITADMVTVNALATAIASGPVASVAGRTGIVVLGISDITGLSSTISGLATTTNLATGLAGKQNASSKLDTLVNLTWAANQLLLLTGTGSLSSLAVSPFIQTLFDDTDAPTAQTTLGISAFIQTLLNDADAPTARTTLGVATATTAAIEFILDGGGAPLTTGVKGYIEVPWPCTVSRVTLLADVSGSVTVDIWRTTYALFAPGTHPVVADSLTAAAVPAIASAFKYQDATLTGWTKTLNAGDILAFNVKVAATNISKVTCSLLVVKS